MSNIPPQIITKQPGSTTMFTELANDCTKLNYLLLATAICGLYRLLQSSFIKLSLHVNDKNDVLQNSLETRLLIYSQRLFFKVSQHSISEKAKQVLGIA